MRKITYVLHHFSDSTCNAEIGDGMEIHGTKYLRTYLRYKGCKFTDGDFSYLRNDVCVVHRKEGDCYTVEEKAWQE